MYRMPEDRSLIFSIENQMNVKKIVIYKKQQIKLLPRTEKIPFITMKEHSIIRY